MQTKKQSLVETSVDMVAGYAINVSVVVLLLGHSTEVATAVGLLMFALGFGRKYLVRRVFNHFHTKD